MNPSTSLSDKPDNTLVWVHGYNVDEDGAEATFAEVFKRLYHSGYKGSFYGVCWYGDPKGFLNPHYHQSVVSAFNFSAEFAEFIKNLDESIINVAAHSLGNLAVGAAIQDKDIYKIKNYFALNAAVLLEAYGDSESEKGMLMVHPVKKREEYRDGELYDVKYLKDESITWLDYYESFYNSGSGEYEKLLSSQWYRLFEDSDDKRFGLKWKNRLKDVPIRTMMYNFYSSSENVLAKYEGDNFAFDGSFWDTGDKAFVKQEKYKGRSSIVPGIAGGPSCFAGWGSNLENGSYISAEIKEEYQTNEHHVKIVETRLKKPFELGSLDEEFMTRLKGEPFFLKNPEAIFSGEDTGAILEENYTSVPELADYYKKENLDASNVNVRDWLLAEAVPGNSWACGVANNDAVMKEFNFDMSAVKNAGSSENYFMTYGEKLKWPRKIGDQLKWWHSDYKNMPYNSVYKFYDKFVDIMKK